MRIIRRIGSLPILPKLILTFLLVLLPIIYIGLKMNESGSLVVKREIANSLTSRIELYMDILEHDFERTIRLLQEYVNDRDLLMLSNGSEIMSDFERTQAVLRLKYRLDLLKKSSQFISNAMVFIPSMNRIVSSNDNAISTFDESLFTALSGPNNLYETPFTLWNDRIFISVPYSETVYNDRPLFLIAVEVSRSEISKALNQFTQEGSESVLVSGQLHWAVSGEIDPAVREELFRSIFDMEPSYRADSGTIQAGDAQYLVAQKASQQLGVTLMMFVPTELVEKPLNDYRSWLMLLSAAAILIVIAFSYGIYRIIHQPLKRLVRSFRRIEQGRFEEPIDYPFQDEFGYLYDQLNAMVRQLKRLIHEVYEQRYRAQLAELRHLQAQINPHFLYNTYFILYRMAQLREHESIVRLTKHLGEYFQYITKDAEEEVPLKNEAMLAKSYMEIQNIRFPNRIAAEIGEVPEEAADLMVPRLTVQPIIENAYKHALERMAKGGLLKVSFAAADGEVRIAVEDNGKELTPERLARLQSMLGRKQEVTEGTGLINVHRRLQIKYGENAGLRIGKAVGGGLQVEIVIPLEGGREDVQAANRR